MYLIRDIFSKEEREKCVEDLQPLLVYIPNCNGKQTYPSLQGHPDFIPLLDRILKLSREHTGLDLSIGNAWGKMSDGKKKSTGWHHHSYEGMDYTSVYYIKVPFLMRNGTLFRDGLVEAPENSLLIFNSHLEHSTPRHWFGIERYILSVNFYLNYKIKYTGP
tara:strand:+ start:84 stop:569 length:486 start_codon:yes stop_codon:yes gene_type:complete